MAFADSIACTEGVELLIFGRHQKDKWLIGSLRNVSRAIGIPHRCYPIVHPTVGSAGSRNIIPFAGPNERKGECILSGFAISGINKHTIEKTNARHSIHHLVENSIGIKSHTVITTVKCILNAVANGRKKKFFICIQILLHVLPFAVLLAIDIEID